MHNLSQRPAAPLLLVSDNAALRLAVSGGRLWGVVGPPGGAVHTSRGAPGEEDVWRTWVELGMLARARCLVVSFSGFSNIARWWGGSDCVRSVDECVAELAAIPMLRDALFPSANATSGVEKSD